MKKIFSLVLALTMLLTGVALADAADTSLDDLLARGELILGLDDSFPPMGYRNEANEIVGYDIDVAREVCARLGVELKLQPIDWAAKEMELDGGNIDCIWNGMSVTPEREAGMALTVPYLNNAMVLIVNDDSIASRDDLAGKALGVQMSSPAEELMDSEAFADFRGTLTEVLPFADYLTAIMDLKNGNIAAVLIDEVVAEYEIKQLGDETLHTIDNLADDLYAIGFRKGDVALRDKVNEILAEMAADGTLAEISIEWFGVDISIVGK